MKKQTKKHILEFLHFWPMTIVVPILLLLILFPGIANAKVKAKIVSVGSTEFYLILSTRHSKIAEVCDQSALSINGFKRIFISNWVVIWIDYDLCNSMETQQLNEMELTFEWYVFKIHDNVS